jgi:zinc protease
MPVSLRPVVVAVILLAAGAAAAAPEVKQRTLENGLDVLVVEDHAQPLVTIEIAFKNGSMTEPPEYNGLSHLYEHMFFKANQVLPDQEAWLARARALGMVWNGTTATERVNYYFSTTTDHFEETMAFMRDAVVAPKFDAAELDRERVVVTGEIDRNEANPFYFLFSRTQRAAFAAYPTRKDPLGTRAAVLAATPEMMRTIQGRYYVPNNAALVVTGDVTAEQVWGSAARLYAGWKRGEDPFKAFPLVTHPPIQKTEVVWIEQPVRAVVGMMIWHGPSVVPAELSQTYAADLLGYAVREPASRFQRALVDSGACLAVNFGWQTAINVGPIQIMFQARPDQATGCLKAILAELPRMKAADYLSDDELRDAAFRAEMDQLNGRERPSALAHVLTFWWASAGLDYWRTYVDNLRRSDRAAIARYLDGYVLGKPFVLGVMTSKEAAASSGLTAAGLELLARGATKEAVR